VPPFRPGDDVYMHTKELSRSIKLVLDADHGFSATFQPTGNKDIPHTGAEMGPQLMGLYAEKTTGERDKKTGKLKVIGDVFIPLSAIVQDPDTCTFARNSRARAVNLLLPVSRVPCTFEPPKITPLCVPPRNSVDCDRNKFPRFFDHSPNIVNLKSGLAKPIARSEDKEKDFAHGFKQYITQLRYLTFKFAVVLIIVHTAITTLYGFAAATLATIPLAYILKTTWQKTKKELKHLWTEQYPTYREYWRFKKDDEIARQFNYNFPFFANHPLLRTVRRFACLLAHTMSLRRAVRRKKCRCVSDQGHCI
jgi:hypothetical protein